MTLVASMDQLVVALSGAQKFPFNKGSFTPVAGGYSSLFHVAGMPGAGAAPGASIAGYTCDDTTSGAINNAFVNPASGNAQLGKFEGSVAGASGTLILYDRLWHNGSGISVTTTGAQTVNSVTLPSRPNTNGAYVEAWLNIIAATAAGTATPSLSYTDQDGNSGATATLAQAYVASSVIHRSYPFVLAAGDNGVRSIQSITLGVSMTSGTIGLVLRRKLAQIHLPISGVGNILTALEGALAGVVYPDACLELVWVSNAATASVVVGSVDVINA